MELQSMARLAARRTRGSCQGDIGSHWSAKYTQNVPWTATGFTVNPGVRLTASAASPRIEYAMSTSPLLSAATRVASSGITFMTSRFTRGALRQYWSNASSTSSVPGVNETNLYGPAPIGAFLKPASPTFVTYFSGTIHPAPVAPA